MVENKHGLSSILSFSAKSVNPKILEALLVGREKIVNQLENRVKNIAKDGLNHQVLIIGARGTGKTHMLSVLHHRIQPFINKEKIVVAYFAEEEYGISGYLDFMVRILNAFIRWNEKDAEFLREQLSILQKTPSSHQEETIKRIVNEYINGKPLLILAENFNDIFDALKKEGQSKLRNWLQQNERISIIATSQALSGDIGKEDKPFYGFFDEINLKPLSLEESYVLLKKLAELENKTDLITHLETKGKAQVKAIHTLVKGNHRLLITFYEFLKSDILSNLSVLFIKTLNDLKPYYETFIRYQTPQQQKVIRFLALAKKPQKGVEIARECFLDPKSLSKQLSELSKKKLVEVITDPADKRNKLYDIAEPLLRISIEIGEQKEGISALFIDFLALYYNQNELENQKNKFSKILEECVNSKEKEKYFFEVDARERALEIQKTLKPSKSNINVKEALKYISQNKFNKVENILNSITDKNEVYYSLLSLLYLSKNKLKEAIDVLRKAELLYPKNETILTMLGGVYAKNNKIDKAISNYKKAIRLNPKIKRPHSELGNIYEKLKDYKNAIKYYKNAIKINSEDDKILFKLGNNYNYENNLEEAIENYQKAIKLNPNNEYYYLMLSTSYLTLEKFRESKIAVKKALKINSNNANTYLHLGLLHFNLKEYNSAIIAFNNSKKISSEDDSVIENLLSKAYIKTNNYKKAILTIYKTISLYINESNNKI